MNLVVLADDAFAFLFSWEFMSLASWALVMAHHRSEATSLRAGYVYLVMASFGTLALLLAFGLLAGTGRAATPSTPSAQAVHAPLVAGLVLGAGAARGGVEGRARAAACLAAARPSGRSQPRLRADERRHDQGRDLRLHPCRVRPSGRTGLVVERGADHARRHHRGARHSLRTDGDDLKRLLACSTIENIGVIFVSLGLALAFRRTAWVWAAALALTAALFHVLNHSMFKSLLFFGAGAVINATASATWKSSAA
jgi:hydrogenase-4 component B